MSGAVARSFTATPMPTLPSGARLPGTTLPCFSYASMFSSGRISRS
jgi:hypothetical protein